MRVVLAGSGGRERALAWRLASSPSLTTLITTAAVPGWPEGIACRPAANVREIVTIAQETRADLVVVGPENLLGEGLADELDRVGIPCFGPTREAARLETSKAYAKEVMQAAGVPTANALIVELSDLEGMRRAEARCAQGHVVLKADGLAAGKGVLVCPTPEEAMDALQGMKRFGDAAQLLLLEDLLAGPELSLFALCDGERAVSLPSAQDHKRLCDHDLGPNTGGMGAIAPHPSIDRRRADALVSEIHSPVIREMASRGHPFRGVLYAGLMLTEQGPIVLEFNVRFGDPECQALMMLWQDDPLPWLYGAATGHLPTGAPLFREEAACCVVLASEGYPDSPVRGTAIDEPPPSLDPEIAVFHAGTRRGPDRILRTEGGRVLSIAARGLDAEGAQRRAYEEASRWRFAGSQMRTDIGGRR